MSTTTETTEGAETELAETIRANIRRLRTDAGMRQDDLAGLTGIPQTTISDLETGKVSVSAARLGVIARALGCDVEAIYRQAQ